MPKYRKLAKVDDAEQFNGSTVHHEMCRGVCRWDQGNCPHEPHVHTTHNQQPVVIEAGDWIVKEPDGNGYYPCKDEIFRAGHDMTPVSEEG